MKNKNRFEVVHKESNGIFLEESVLIDKETGVNYLYVQSVFAGGLTPLLDADGKPVITR